MGRCIDLDPRLQGNQADDEWDAHAHCQKFVYSIIDRLWRRLECFRSKRLPETLSSPNTTGVVMAGENRWEGPAGTMAGQHIPAVRSRSRSLASVRQPQRSAHPV